MKVVDNIMVVTQIITFAVHAGKITHENRLEVEQIDIGSGGGASGCGWELWQVCLCKKKALAWQSKPLQKGQQCKFRGQPASSAHADDQPAAAAAAAAA